jgi:hypothetical protein
LRSLFIPFSFQKRINNPRPSDDGKNSFWVVFQEVESEFETIFESVKGVEDEVMEELFSQFIPKVFDGVQFG